ncbi:Odorant receptor 49b [Carabus blaptoides fortunei]
MLSQSYFSFITIILKLAGAWEPAYDSRWRNVLLDVYNVVCLTFTLVFFYGSEVAFTIASRDNISLLLQCITWLATHTAAVFKTLLWLFNRRQILKVIRSLDASEFQYEATDSFDPSEVMKMKNKYNYIYLSLHFWAGQMIPVTNCLGAIASLYLEQTNHDMTVANTSVCDNLPFPTYIPWITDTKLRCLFTIIAQGIGVGTFGFMIISMDGMFTSSVSFITAHFLVLQGAFRSLLPRAMLNMKNHNGNGHDLDGQINVEMNKCVKHLQTLLSAVDNIENMYKFQTLTMALVTLFVVCNNLFIISTMPITSKAFLGHLSYLLTCEVEFSAYCWFGNELTLACAHLTQALYESDWIQFNAKVKRSILLTMTRMDRPVTLSMGKFSPLTLNTLVSTLRGSYSFFAVLKQMNDS